MRKKRFAFVLAAALCAVSVGALAGCSGGTGGNSGETPGGTAETKEYTVTFDSAGGTAVQSVTVQEGATLKAPEAPVKATFSARYDFTGWYYEGRLWVIRTLLTATLRLRQTGNLRKNTQTCIRRSHKKNRGGKK